MLLVHSSRLIWWQSYHKATSVCDDLMQWRWRRKRLEGLTPRRSSLYLLIKRGKRSRAARRRKLSVSLRYFKSPATTRLRTKNCIRLGASQLERMLKPRLRLPREHYRLQFVHEARACSSRELHARNYALRKKSTLP